MNIKLNTEFLEGKRDSQSDNILQDIVSKSYHSTHDLAKQKERANKLENDLQRVRRERKVKDIFN